jgi:hypothetical protein
MSCDLTNEYIMKHFDGTLNDIENAQLKQHLKTCVKCSETFNDLSMIFNALEATDLVEPPLNFETEVMEKVSALENARKERNATIAAFLYNIATVLSIIMLTAFVTNFNDIGIFRLPDGSGGGAGSFSEILLMMYNFLSGFYHFIFSLFTTFIEINLAIFEAYYHIFAVLCVLALAGQQMFALIREDRGSTR